MVNTGRPSRGCATCRRRKIKCDEKAPECSYCFKTKQKCPGYKDSFDLTWRDQNIVAKTSVERRKQQSINTRTLTSSMICFPKDSEVVSNLLNYAKPCRTLSPRPEHLALDFYFQIYIPPGLSTFNTRAWDEYIAQMFLASGQQSLLRKSTTALAGALFVAWLGHRPDNPLSRLHYFEAVSMMKSRVAQQDVSDDEILMSVLLLQKYEVMIGRAAQRAAPSAHLEGALSLVRHRGLKTFCSRASQELLCEVRSQLIHEAYRSNTSLSPDVATWTNQLSDPGLSPLYQLDNIDAQLANLNSRIMHSLTNYPALTQGTQHAFPLMPPIQCSRSFSNNSNILESKLDSPIYDYSDRILASSLLGETQRLDDELVLWTLTLPPEWQPVRVTGHHCLPTNIPTYQDWAEIYPNVHVARTWNAYRVARIRALVIQYVLASTLERAHSPSRTFLYEQNVDHSCYHIDKDPEQSYPLQPTCILMKIQLLTDLICATVPYYLGSRIKPGPVGDRSVAYPHLVKQPVDADHYRSAPAMAGWQLLGPLSYIMSLQVPLRQDQKGWVSSQLLRIANIYNMRR